MCSYLHLWCVCAWSRVHRIYQSAECVVYIINICSMIQTDVRWWWLLRHFFGSTLSSQRVLHVSIMMSMFNAPTRPCVCLCLVAFPSVLCTVSCVLMCIFGRCYFMEGISLKCFCIYLIYTQSTRTNALHTIYTANYTTHTHTHTLTQSTEGYLQKHAMLLSEC